MESNDEATKEFQAIHDKHSITKSLIQEAIITTYKLTSIEAL